MNAETRVVRASSTLTVPTIGVVIGHEDEDRVLVLWGDAAYSPRDYASARIENVDDLRVIASRWHRWPSNETTDNRPPSLDRCLRCGVHRFSDDEETRRRSEGPCSGVRE